MNSQMTDAIPFGATAVAATQVQIVINGVAGLKTRLSGLALGFSGTAPTSAVQATVSDGVTTMYISVGTAPVVFSPDNPAMFAAGATLTITLPAGSAGAIGSIAGCYYQDK